MQSFNRLYTLVVLLVMQVAMSGNAFSHEIQKTSELVIAQDSYLSPNAIKQSDNGDLFIVGLNEGKRSAIILRTDEKGALKWQHETPLLDPSLPSAFRSYYQSLAIMRDNTIFACGVTARTGPRLTGLITHISSEGKQLDEQFLIPNDNQEFNGRILDCVDSNYGFIAFGVASRPKPKSQREQKVISHEQELYYWILGVDEVGKKKWEKLVPISSELRGFPDSISALNITSGQFVFAACRNGLSTELIKLDDQGKVLNRVVHNGSLLLVHSQGADHGIELVSATKNPITLSKLNSDLREERRETFESEPGSTVGAYRFSDSSLVLAGAENISNMPFANVLQIDTTSKKTQSLVAVTTARAYSVAAAVQTANQNEVICISESRGSVNADVKESSGGIVLSFVDQR